MVTSLNISVLTIDFIMLSSIKKFLISLLHPFLFLASVVVIGFVAVVVAAAAAGVANANYIKCC